MSGTTLVLSQEQLDEAVAFANTQAERSSEVALKTAVIAVALIAGGVALAILCHYNSTGYYVGLGTALIPGVTFAGISGYHKLDSLGYQKLQKLKNEHSLEVFQLVIASYEATNKGKHPMKWGYFNSGRVDDLSEQFQEMASYIQQCKQKH